MPCRAPLAAGGQVLPGVNALLTTICDGVSGEFAPKGYVDAHPGSGRTGRVAIRVQRTPQQHQQHVLAAAGGISSGTHRH